MQMNEFTALVYILCLLISFNENGKLILLFQFFLCSEYWIFFRLEILHPFFDITLYVNRYLTSFDKIYKKKMGKRNGMQM